jgi:hypothetical protein
MLALDHLLNFIEYLDCTFIVGDKQGLQDCFKIINSLRPGAGLEGPVASNLGDEIVNDVSFLIFGHAPKHYSFIQLTEHSSRTYNRGCFIIEPQDFFVRT